MKSRFKSALNILQSYNTTQSLNALSERWAKLLELGLFTSSEYQKLEDLIMMKIAHIETREIPQGLPANLIIARKL